MIGEEGKKQSHERCRAVSNNYLDLPKTIQAGGLPFRSLGKGFDRAGYVSDLAEKFELPFVKVLEHSGLTPSN